MRSSVALVLGVVLVAACSTEPTEARSPPSSLASPPAEPQPEVDPQVVPSEVDALGLGTRFAMARDRSAPSCRRFLQHAVMARAEVGAVERGAADAPKVVAAHLGRLSSTFGAFDGLLLGEIQRSRATYEVDGGLTDAELSLLTLDLRAHLRAAGVPAPDLDALDDALDALAASGGPSTTPAARAALGKLVVRLALLLSTLQTCAPHGT